MRASKWLLLIMIPSVHLGLMGNAIAGTCGLASYYHEGQRTANGERFKPDGMTAAHRTLPFGTMLNIRRGEYSVTVRINDRGPFVRGRILDLSRGAARALKMTGASVTRVCF